MPHTQRRSAVLLDFRPDTEDIAWQDLHLADTLVILRVTTLTPGKCPSLPASWIWLYPAAVHIGPPFSPPMGVGRI